MDARFASRSALLIGAVVVGLIVPSAASAWTVTVHVHGAGTVTETTPAHLMSCSVGPASKAESTVTDCVAGSPNGDYGSGFIVNLQASVHQSAFDRGWRFLKWVDSSAGGQINCDPQGTTGDHFSVICQFQIFQNLETNLYFDDVAGPDDTLLSGGPPALTNQTAASFTFDAASDPDATYECRLSRPGEPVPSFTSCGSPADKSESYSSLTANGQYTFAVRGKDPSGNVDATPATYSWTVDTVPPVPAIAGGPAHGSTTSSTSASFGVNIVNGEAGGLTCNLDGVVTSCTPGTTKTYPGPLGQGPHSFTLTATDQVGNSASVSRAWTVDSLPPTVLITAGPANGAFTKDVDHHFVFSANEAATFECSRDNGPFITCSGPQDMNALADGPHSFAVRAKDALQNQSAAVMRSFTVDTAPPDTTLLISPAEGSTTPSTSALFAFGSPESGLTFECKLDDQPFATCASPLTLTGLTNADHTFQVRAVDLAGNRDPQPVTRTWRVNTLDADSDGINRPQDCDDANPAIRPGATDTPGNGVDEDCSGSDATVPVQPPGPPPPPPPAGPLAPPPPPPAGPGADSGKAPLPRVGSAVAVSSRASRRQTVITALSVRPAKAGSSVRLSCTGRGCPFKTKTRSVTTDAAKLDLTSLLKRAKLRPGARLEIRVTKPNTIGVVRRLEIRAGKAPKSTSLCLAPGATRPGACTT